MASNEQNQLNREFLDAATAGNLERLRLLHHEGAALDARDTDLRTAMHLGAMNGHGPIVAYMLEEQMDARVMDELFDTPLMLAVRFNKIAAVQAFVDGNANLDNSEPGFTALMLSAECDSPEATAALIRGGAGLNFVNASGMTALMIAAEKKNPRAFDLLLEAGADTQKKASNGKTVLDFARDAGMHDMLQKLTPHFKEFAKDNGHGVASEMGEGLQSAVSVGRPLSFRPKA